MVAILWLLALGTVVYCFLILVAVYRYLSVPLPSGTERPPISILKPLKGVDLDLEANLRSAFEQDYKGDWEILFALADASDPATEIVAKLQDEFPRVHSRLLIVGEPAYANAKVWSLEKLCTAAAHDLVVMSDSDIRVTPAMLSTVAAEFSSNPKLGVATCPYRAVGVIQFQLGSHCVNKCFPEYRA